MKQAGRGFRLDAGLTPEKREWEGRFEKEGQKTAV